MNIFILDKDPVVAASLQCDKHVVKVYSKYCNSKTFAKWTKRETPH